MAFLLILSFVWHDITWREGNIKCNTQNTLDIGVKQQQELAFSLWRKSLILQYDHHLEFPVLFDAEFLEAFFQIQVRNQESAIIRVWHANVLFFSLCSALVVISSWFHHFCSFVRSVNVSRTDKLLFWFISLFSALDSFCNRGWLRVHGE